jgi:hypothetical protein
MWILVKNTNFDNLNYLVQAYRFLGLSANETLEQNPQTDNNNTCASLWLVYYFTHVSMCALSMELCTYAILKEWWYWFTNCLASKLLVDVFMRCDAIMRCVYATCGVSTSGWKVPGRRNRLCDVWCLHLGVNSPRKKK